MKQLQDWLNTKGNVSMYSLWTNSWWMSVTHLAEAVVVVSWGGTLVGKNRLSCDCEVEIRTIAEECEPIL